MAGKPTEGGLDGTALTREYSADDQNGSDRVETAKFDALGCSVCDCDLLVLADLRVESLDRRKRTERWECPVCRTPVEEYREVDA